MINKKIILNVFCTLLFLYTSHSSQALTFYYDNYASIAPLKYSFTFDNNHWFTHQDMLYLKQLEFKTIKFDTVPPWAWKIEAATGKNIHCWNHFDKQKKPVANIVTLNDPKNIDNNELLLDVIDEGTNGLLVQIIDINGNQAYSNTLSCVIDEINK